MLVLLYIFGAFIVGLIVGTYGFYGYCKHLLKKGEEAAKTPKEYEEYVKKYGFVITIKNDEKGNHVDRFFNGETVDVDTKGLINGKVEVKYTPNK